MPLMCSILGATFHFRIALNFPLFLPCVNRPPLLFKECFGSWFYKINILSELLPNLSQFHFLSKNLSRLDYWSSILTLPKRDDLTTLNPYLACTSKATTPLRRAFFVNLHCAFADHQQNLQIMKALIHHLISRAMNFKR